jgi:hypothetical protein
MTTFAVMKRKRKVLFKIMFLLIVFSSGGLSAYSKNNIKPYILELSTCTNNCENSYTSDNDSINDDQIDQSFYFCFPEKDFCPVSIKVNCSIFSDFCFSVWQPPKIF